MRSVLAESTSLSSQVAEAEEEPTESESTMSVYDRCKVHIEMLINHIKDAIKQVISMMCCIFYNSYF